jgi:hypothetical protein
MNRTWRTGVVPLYLTGYRKTANSLSSDFSRMARRRLAVLCYVSRRFPETPAAVLSLARGRLRAVIAAEAFRRKMVFRGLAELARACRLAFVCALEVVAVDLAGRIRRSVRFGRSSRRGQQPDLEFFYYDPEAPAAVPRRPFEKRKLDALGKAEETFFQSARPLPAPGGLRGDFSSGRAGGRRPSPSVRADPAASTVPRNSLPRRQ